jgi:hypothetical protein
MVGREEDHLEAPKTTPQNGFNAKGKCTTFSEPRFFHNETLQHMFNVELICSWPIQLENFKATGEAVSDKFRQERSGGERKRLFGNHET